MPRAGACPKIKLYSIKSSSFSERRKISFPTRWFQFSSIKLSENILKHRKKVYSLYSECVHEKKKKILPKIICVKENWCKKVLSYCKEVEEFLITERNRKWNSSRWIKKHKNLNFKTTNKVNFALWVVTHKKIYFKVNLALSTREKKENEEENSLSLWW